MDTFMEIVKKMEKMSPEEKQQVIMKNRSICICGECPSYTSCLKEKDELLFCATGKSECTIGMKSCICPTCPVTGIMGLSHAYYCIRGSEKELRRL